MSKNIFMLFAPHFSDVPLDLASKLIKKNQDIKITGIVTGSRRTYTYIENNKPSNVTNLDYLDDLERQWIKSEYNIEVLKSYEEKFGKFNLKRIIIADRHLGSGFVSGGRTINSDLSSIVNKNSSINYNYLQGIIQYFLLRLNNEEIDLVFCYVIAGAPAMALKVVAQFLDIPIKIINTCRLSDYFILDDSEALLNPIVSDYEKICKGLMDDDPLYHKALDFLENYRKAPTKPNYMINNELIIKNKSSLINFFNKYSRVIPKIFSYKANKTLRHSGFIYFYDEFLTYINKNLQNKKFEDSVYEHKLPQNFFFYPLHVEPESSTMVLTPLHTDQLSVIESIAKSLPIGTKLIVKEHLPMLGKRASGFYARIRNMPDVILLSPKFNSLELIKRAELTFVISGTAAWEAVLLKKKAVVIGLSPYDNLFGGIFNCSDLSKLPSYIDLALHAKINDDKNVVYFIMAIMKYGFHMDSLFLWDAKNYKKEKKDQYEEIIETLVSKIEIALEL